MKNFRERKFSYEFVGIMIILYGSGWNYSLESLFADNYTEKMLRLILGNFKKFKKILSKKFKILFSSQILSFKKTFYPKNFIFYPKNQNFLLSKKI
jgi:hypothetical protein